MTPEESFAKARQDSARMKCDESIRKKQNRHDWYIAVFNVAGGAVAGLITSVIFWLLTT